MKKIFFINFIIILILGCIVFDAFFIEPDILIEQEENLYLPNWNKKLDGLKIAVLSDFHIGVKNTSLEKVEKIVQKVNAKNPDIIFILGDYDAKYIKNNYSSNEVRGVLKKFKSKYGIISVLGNHDYSPNRVVKDCLKDTGIILLENNNKYLTINNQKLKVVGLKDYWYFPKTNPKAVIGAIDSPIIVLSHNPDLFVKIPSKTSLTLSGHTHGGDIILPIIGSPFVPSKYGNRFIKGHIIENNRHLFVTSGTTTTTGVRFLNPPEIVFLTLYSKTAPQEDTKPILGIKKNYQSEYTKLAKKVILTIKK